jgi:HK97 family phage major capsid protein
MSAFHEYMREAVAISEQAEHEGRQMTAEEYAKGRELHQRALADAGETKAWFTGSGELSNGVRLGGGASHGPGLGDMFVESKAYQQIKDPANRGQQWSTGPVELQTKTTLTTTPGTALTPPQYQPGIVETLFQPTGFADLFGQDTTTASQVRYVVESTATNAAAGVAEGGLKPESSFVFTETVEPVRKVATLLPVSDEMLEDSTSIRAYLNGRLALFVSIQEEAQLLLGNGTAPNLAGVITPTGPRTIGTFTRSAGTSNELAILKAAVGTRGSSWLEPDTLIVHPQNWQAIRAGTDSTGQYFGGGPFGYSYGGGAATPLFSAPIWGMRVFVSSNITVGTALIGNFQTGASVVRRKGITVEASNSHSTFFATNVTTLRAESRLALCVYRPSAFTAIVGLA